RAARRTRPRAAAARKSAGPDLRHDAVAADVDPVGFECPVRLLGRTGNIDVGPRLELVLAADQIGADHGIGTDDDLLLAVLILTMITCPSTPATVVSTVALVMVVFGRSHGRWPSPVPRCVSAKIMT